uniref:hypothetical protein n=1 Tax=Neorhizobium sp. EC2-8 TaxID=3129230 RepID=UPI003100F9AF
MKLATFRSSTGSNHIGIVNDGDRRLFDLTAAAAQNGDDASVFSSMLALIDAGDAGLEKARTLFAARGSDTGLTVTIDSVELLALCPNRARCATA